MVVVVMASIEIEPLETDTLNTCTTRNYFMQEINCIGVLQNIFMIFVLS